MKTTKKRRSSNTPSLRYDLFPRGLAAFLVLACAIIFYFLLLNFDKVQSLFEDVFRAIAPVFTGLLFAYLLNPAVVMLEKHLAKPLSRRSKNSSKGKKAARIISTFVTVIAVVCLIVLLFVLVVPEVAGSITAIAGELPSDLGEFTDTVNQKVQNNSRLSALYSLVSNYLAEPLESWANSGILNNASVWVGYLASGIMGAFNLVYNLCVGLIICFYLLIGKERFMRQGGKILYVMLKPNRADWILHRLNGANRTFSSAILGKILDSIIIGMLCFIGVVILRTPYPALIAVIVGVTNVIPFFGPFIGAIPSTLLVLMHDPVKALYFVIFIVVLQQFDCNILDPKIVGGSIGLPAFWSLFACLLGGGLFGLVGLLLGVPTFAVLYNLCKELIDERLRFSKLPPETLDKLGIKPELDPNAPSFFDPDEFDEEQAVVEMPLSEVPETTELPQKTE